MFLQVFELGSPQDLDSLPWFGQLRTSAWAVGDKAQTVARIIDDVAADRDQAVVRYMRQWSNPNYTLEDIRVGPGDLSDALAQLPSPLRKALEAAISHVRAYQQHIMPVDPKPLTIGGAELGLRFTAVGSVGLLVPGGKAAYPSSVIMLAVPAIEAGVDPKSIHVITPPPTGSTAQPEPPRVSALVLATCALLGIERVYRIGGDQGVAALALGTKKVPAVDMIVGPGNVYTQLAKLQLYGRVGIDGFCGPSEILTIADESADPTFVAADLIAQAEHDPGRCYLVAWSHRVIGRVNEEIERQLEQRQRRSAIADSLQHGSAALLVKDKDQALRVADRIAAEHVLLAVEDPDSWLGLVHHGGAYFLGDQSPVAAGDYLAGPSHCLPTGTTARYASGISVYTFLKRSGVVAYRQGMGPSAIQMVARLAGAEGLDGHAASVRARSRH